MSAGRPVVSTPQSDAVRRYLEQAAAAESTFEIQLRDFARRAQDDADVKDFFDAHAEQTAQQHERLLSRLAELGGPVVGTESATAAFLNVSPQIAQGSAVAEEQQLQNIMVAYALEAGESSFYERIAQLAHMGADSATEALVRSIQGQEQAAADKLWRLLPTRAKIAFNMLTVSELDPAVETKMADDRIES